MSDKAIADYLTTRYLTGQNRHRVYLPVTALDRAGIPLSGPVTIAWQPVPGRLLVASAPPGSGYRLSYDGHQRTKVFTTVRSLVQAGMPAGPVRQLWRLVLRPGQLIAIPDPAAPDPHSRRRPAARPDTITLSRPNCQGVRRLWLPVALLVESGLAGPAVSVSIRSGRICLREGAGSGQETRQLIFDRYKAKRFLNLRNSKLAGHPGGILAIRSRRAGRLTLDLGEYPG